jgi:gamma-glutamyltranspeptidase / glutathione hydrolase
VTLAPYSTRYAAEAIVCTVDNLAAQAGVEALRCGGSAADAAIAAGAVLAVTQEHQCGLGGDLLAVVHRAGDKTPSALCAAGRAGSGADPARLRAAGHEQMPVHRDPGCAPVPGCVDGWFALHERFGRLDLEVVLAAARKHAASGFAASQALAQAAPLLAGVAHADDFTANGPLIPGHIVRRPGVARALQAIARGGRRGFYEGEFGEALLEAGGGEYTTGDLSRAQAEWVQPLGIDAFGRRLWSLPPSSQGYLLLRSAAIASSLQLPDPEDPEWAHLLIECSREAAADRAETWHEASAGQTLIATEVIASMRARITDRAGAGAPAAVPGGTVSLCVVDRDRLAVSMLQSNFTAWGSLRFVPGVGVALHNRGSCFSLEPGSPAEYGPRRRPPHTLAPALMTSGDGSLEATLATRGGHIQPQILLQLLARLCGASQTVASAIAAGRWAQSEDALLLEGQASASWDDGLSARGHRAQRRPPFSDEFGHAQVIVADRDHLAAASDPRSHTWAVGAL